VKHILKLRHVNERDAAQHDVKANQGRQSDALWIVASQQPAFVRVHQCGIPVALSDTPIAGGVQSAIQPEEFDRRTTRLFRISNDADAPQIAKNPQAP
jgi:hypothetical protein